MSKKSKEKRKIVYGNATERALQHDSGFNTSYIEFPDGLSNYKWREGTNRIDIIPFFIGKNHPFAKKGQTVAYERTIWLHSGIGPDEKKILCPRKNLNEPCAACDYAAKLRLNPKADKKVIDSFRPQERQLFLVIDRTDSESREKGIQLLDSAYYKSFGQLLDKMLKKTPEAAEFHRLDKGLTVKVTTVEDEFNSRTYNKPVKVDFFPRKKPYDESLLDEAPCLDDILKPLDEEEFAKLFKQTGASKDEDEDDEDNDKEDEDEEDEDGSDEDEDEEESEDEEGETADDLGIEVGSTVKHKKHGKCKVVHVSKDGTMLRLEDEDEEVHKAIPPSQCKLVEEDDEDKEEDDEEDEAPKKKKKGKVKKPVKKKKSKEDEDDDEDEEDESDEDDEEEDQEEEDEDSDEEEDDDDPFSDDEGEDEDEEDEDEPPKKKKKKGGK